VSAPIGRPADLFQLDRPTCLALLGAHHRGRVVIEGPDPSVIPVDYRAVDGIITFRSAAIGRLEGPVPDRAVFEVDVIDDRTRSGWSVLVRGRLMPVPADRDGAPADPCGADRRWMIVPVDAVTGRVLRGAVDDDLCADGYL
jgi:hypothetical protein